MAKKQTRAGRKTTLKDLEAKRDPKAGNGTTAAQGSTDLAPPRGSVIYGKDL